MQGLITKGRKCLDPAVARFARGFGPEEVEDLHEGASLVEVVFKFC
jgi:malate dehydrogenase (decarboxylating)